MIITIICTHSARDCSAWWETTIDNNRKRPSQQQPWSNLESGWSPWKFRMAQLVRTNRPDCNENLLQFLDGISTTNEVYFYSVPDLESLVLGREVGEKCSNEVVQRKVGDSNFVGNFNLTFSLPGTLVCLSIIVLRCITTLMYSEYQQNWQNGFLNDHRHAYSLDFVPCQLTKVPTKPRMLTPSYVSFLQGLIETQKFNFTKCHPGYTLDPTSCLCVCDKKNSDIIRCDTNTSRFIYLRVSLKTSSFKYMILACPPSFYNNYSVSYMQRKLRDDLGTRLYMHDSYVWIAAII